MDIEMQLLKSGLKALSIFVYIEVRTTVIILEKITIL